MVQYHSHEDEILREKEMRTARKNRQLVHRQVQEFVGDVDEDRLDELEDEESFSNFERFRRKTRR